MIVEVGNQEIEFPDSMSVEEVQAAMRRLMPPKAKDAGPNPATEYGGLPLRPFGLDTGLTMPEGVSRVMAGAGAGLANLARGAGQTLGVVDTQNIRDAEQRDAPLMDTAGGMTGNILGTVSGLAPAAFIPGANTLAGASAIGAGTGLMAPVTDDNVAVGKLRSAAIGGLFGGGAIAAGRAAHGAYSGLKGLVEPFREAGQQAIVGRALNRFATNADDVANTAANARATVPGYAPTLAEVAQDPGISALQRGLMNTPDAAGVIGAVENSNAVALKNAIGLLGGDDAAMTAAQTARKQASEPLYTAARQSTSLADPSRTVSLIDRITKANPANKALITPLNEIRESLFEAYPLQQRGSDAWKALNDVLSGPYGARQGSVALKEARTVMDRVRKGTITADEALEQLKPVTKKLSGVRNKTFADALDIAKQHIKTPDYVLRQNPQHLMSAVDNVKALLGKQENAFVKRELTTIKKSLTNQLAKATPEFKQAERTFAQMSQPINQMQIGGLLSNKLSPALDDFAQGGGLNANAYAAALRDSKQVVKQATGLKNKDIGDVLTPEQMATINNVGTTLARRVSANNLSRPVGTNTAQNLASQNLMQQIAGPLGVPASFMEARVWPTILRPFNAALRGQEPAINQKMAEAITNPQLAAQLMRAGVPKEKVGPLIQKMARYGAMPGLLSVNTTQQ